MKAKVVKALKTIGKIYSIYYIVAIIATIASTIFCAVMYGTDTVLRIYRNTWCHIKNMWHHIIHFRWKEYVREAADNSLDGSYVCMQKACGQEFTEEVMNRVYDALDKGVIPFSRVRCPADKPADGPKDLLEREINSGEYPRVDFGDLDGKFYSRPIGADDVPEDILRAAGDIG